MTQSHEIRCHANGSIDFDFYRAQATAMRSQSRRDTFKHIATFKFVLATAAVLGVVTFLSSEIQHRVLDNSSVNDAARIEARERQFGSFFQWPAGPRPESAHLLRERVDVLANSDPLKWWDGYGKGTSRGQAAVLTDLQRRLGGTAAVMAIR